jgi:DNA modification methylase
MEIEVKKIKDLKPNPLNPRKSSVTQDENLKKSLEKFGVVEPIVFNKQSGYIVGGHFRVRELKKLGYKEVECVIVDLSPDDEKELLIRLNANTGDWDTDLLLQDWDADKLADWGVDMPKFETAETIEAKEDDYEIPDQIQTDIVLGDLFEIGNHRLLCGDSTDSDSVAKLMNGEKADMVFTDPPYALFGNSTGVAGVVDDNMVRPFFKNIMKMCQNNTKQFGHIYMCCDWHSAFSIQNCARDVDLKAKNMCIWDKGDGGVGAMYQQCYEIVWFFDNSPTSKQTMGKIKAGVITVNGVPNIWRVPRVTKEREHNAQKPIEMIFIPIKNATATNELCLDLFLGSGSTMVAAHQLKRKCYGMELDSKYCQVIVDRMKKLDPTLVIKKNGVGI